MSSPSPGAAAFPPRSAPGAAPAPPPRDADAAEDVRLILVGRTGLDTVLRPFGPVRVRRAIDAVGELADGVAHDGAPGALRIVLVGPDADPGAGGRDARAAAFIGALRHLAPGVRILRAGEGEPGPYDGAVRPGQGLDAILGASDRPGSAARPAPASAAPLPHAAPPAPPPPVEDRRPVVADVPLRAPAPLTEVAASAAPHGDEALAEALARGEDITAPALDLIRARAADASVRFIAADQPAPPGAAEVARNSHRFGWLVREGGAAGASLAPFASWLGAWLALAAQQAQLRQEAFTDHLTGAWNRRYFERFLAAVLAGAQRDRRHVTILVFDIDDFKQYNDRFGHGAGDSILIEAVRLLRSVIRPSDKVCRIGGDEFAVIFHEPQGPREPTSRHPESISEIAQRFQRQICAHRFPKLGAEAPGTLTVSGGLATFPWDGRTAEELLAKADERALQAKRAGKNTIVLGPGAEDVCAGR